MYATRPLSLYRNFPGGHSDKPPGVPYSGYLVVTDEEAEAQLAFCWGVCNNRRVTKLPFPQDKIVKIVNASDYEKLSVKKVWFIPVLDHPLSSNRYYVIMASGKYKGLACTCSKEDDIAGCCFRGAITDVKPTTFNHTDIYQQFEIHQYYERGFYAKCVAGDGFPPKFLRIKGWKAYTSTSLPIREAQGLNFPPPMRFPGFDFPLYYKCSPAVVIAKWYCPYVFVKEQAKVSEQVRISLVYEMTLQQWWEQIYSCENEGGEGDSVSLNASVKRETVLIYGIEAARDERHYSDDGFVWFKVDDQVCKRGEKVGLGSAIVEKMRWVEEKRGGICGGEREERVERVEEMRNGRGWKRFGCYVLVESFVLKRMDGVVLLSWKFRHTHKTKCKWE